MLHHGLYEQVINNALTSELAEIPEARKAIGFSFRFLLTCSEKSLHNNIRTRKPRFSHLPQKIFHRP